MTDLDRPVYRRTKLPFAHYRRRLVVALEPGDTIAMRLERTRTIYRAPLSAVYRQLAEWHAMAERGRKKPRRRGSL
jgi:hypothetical protein